jgi:hypothetical protein
MCRTTDGQKEGRTAASAILWAPDVVAACPDSERSRKICEQSTGAGAATICMLGKGNEGNVGRVWCPRDLPLTTGWVRKHIHILDGSLNLKGWGAVYCLPRSPSLCLLCPALEWPTAPGVRAGASVTITQDRIRSDVVTDSYVALARGAAGRRFKSAAPTVSEWSDGATACSKPRTVLPVGARPVRCG